MPTTGKILGRNLLVYSGATAVAHSTSCSLSMNRETIDATTKDSTANYLEKIPGNKSWSISSEHMLALDAAYGLDELFTAYENGTDVPLKFSTEVSGDTYFEGNALITSIEVEAGNGDVSTYSVSFEGVGALTKATVA